MHLIVMQLWLWHFFWSKIDHFIKKARVLHALIYVPKKEIANHVKQEKRIDLTFVLTINQQFKITAWSSRECPWLTDHWAKDEFENGSDIKRRGKTMLCLRFRKSKLNLELYVFENQSIPNIQK